MSSPPWFKQRANEWLWSPEIMLLDPLEEYVLLRLRMHMWTAPNCMLPDNDTILMRLSRLEEYRGLEGDLTSEAALSKCLATAKQMLSKCLVDGKQMLCDEELLAQRSALNVVSEKRAAAGSVGGSRKKSGTKVAKAKGKQTISISPSRSGSDQGECEGDVVRQYGEHLRMTPNEHAELCRMFTPALVAEQLPELDLWIGKTDSKNGPRYRRPEHNHYLLARTTWLPGKRLKRAPNAPIVPNMTAAERKQAAGNRAILAALNEGNDNDKIGNSPDALRVSGLLADIHNPRR